MLFPPLFAEQSVKSLCPKLPFLGTCHSFPFSRLGLQTKSLLLASGRRLRLPHWFLCASRHFFVPLFLFPLLASTFLGGVCLFPPRILLSAFCLLWFPESPCSLPAFWSRRLFLVFLLLAHHPPCGFLPLPSHREPSPPCWSTSSLSAVAGKYWLISVSPQFPLTSLHLTSGTYPQYSTENCSQASCLTYLLDKFSAVSRAVLLGSCYIGHCWLPPPNTHPI